MEPERPGLVLRMNRAGRGPKHRSGLGLSGHLNVLEALKANREPDQGAGDPGRRGWYLFGTVGSRCGFDGSCTLSRDPRRKSESGLPPLGVRYGNDKLEHHCSMECAEECGLSHKLPGRGKDVSGGLYSVTEMLSVAGPDEASRHRGSTPWMLLGACEQDRINAVGGLCACATIVMTV